LTSTERQNFLDQTMGRALIFGLVLVALFPSAQADVAVEGWGQYNYNYVITNIGDYPDYVFLTSSGIWGWEHITVIENRTGSFGGGYKLDSFQVNAIKSSKLDWNALKDEGEVINEEDKPRVDFFEDNPNIASSNLNLPVATSLEDTQNIDDITVYLKVNSIEGRSINLSETRVVYRYLDGHIETIPINGDDIPAPTNWAGNL
jgi:hypothetical protein